MLNLAKNITSDVIIQTISDVIEHQNTPKEDNKEKLCDVAEILSIQSEKEIAFKPSCPIMFTHDISALCGYLKDVSENRLT